MSPTRPPERTEGLVVPRAQRGRPEARAGSSPMIAPRRPLPTP